MIGIKMLRASILILLLVPQVLFADCDWSQGIKPTDHSTFEYSEACHKAVGQIHQEILISAKKIEDLNKAVHLKDSAILIANQRANEWLNNAMELEERFRNYDRMQKENTWLYFGLGILTVVATSVAINQVRR